MSSQPTRSLSPEERARLEVQLEEFRASVLKYYPRLVELGQTETDSDSSSHPDRLLEDGQRIQEIRRGLEISRSEIGGLLGVDDVFFAAFEAGMIPRTDLPSGFVPGLKSILTERLRQKHPEWYDESGKLIPEVAGSNTPA